MTELVFLGTEDKKPAKIKLRNCIVTEAPPNNTLFEMSTEMFMTNVYTPPDQMIADNDVVMDIGANIFLRSLQPAKHEIQSIRSSHRLRIMNSY